MAQRRGRIAQGSRLLGEAAKYREAAEQLPPGTQPELLIKRSQQADAAAQMDDWLAAPNQPAPASLRQLITSNQKVTRREAIN